MSTGNLVLIKEKNLTLKTNALIKRILDHYENKMSRNSKDVGLLPSIQTKNKVTNESRANNDFNKRHSKHLSENFILKQKNERMKIEYDIIIKGKLKNSLIQTNIFKIKMQKYLCKNEKLNTNIICSKFNVGTQTD